MVYQPTPNYLNWERWLGPAPLRSYHREIVESARFPNWRWYREYGGGILSDWGAHMFDIVQWALKWTKVDLLNMKPPLNLPPLEILKMYYENGVEVEHRNFGQDLWNDRNKMVKKMGSMDISRKYFEPSQKELVATDLKSSDTKLYVSESHERDWIKAAKADQKPICDVEIGHRTATICHIANQLAYEFRRPI